MRLLGLLQFGVVGFELLLSPPGLLFNVIIVILDLLAFGHLMVIAVAELGFLLNIAVALFGVHEVAELGHFLGGWDI